MASAEFAPDLFSRRRICLAEIDAAVSARLGPTRGTGNSQPACFNRQVAMYLARHVGRWTTAVIGDFYDTLNHSTVSYGIQRIEAMRESDPDVDALITELKRQLTSREDAVTVSVGTHGRCPSVSLGRTNLEELADLIATRICAYIESRPERRARNGTHAMRSKEPGSTAGEIGNQGSGSREVPARSQLVPTTYPSWRTDLVLLVACNSRPQFNYDRNVLQSLLTFSLCVRY